MTDSKKTKKQLIEELERYRRLFDNAPLGYQSLDKSGNFIEVNDTWCKTLGYSREDVLGRNFSEFLHPDFREHFKENFPKFKSMGYILGVEFEMIKKDGTEIIVSFNGKIGYNEDGSFRQTHCILSDITERKLAEDALRESEEKYRTLIESSSDFIFLVDNRGIVISANKAAADIVGRKQQEVCGKNVSDLFPNEVARGYKRNLKNVFETGEGANYETTLAIGEHTSWINTNLNPVTDIAGKVIAVLGIRDITARKQVEDALRESVESLQSVFRAAPTGIGVVVDRVLTQVNERMCEITGYSEEDLIGQSARMLYPTDEEFEYVGREKYAQIRDHGTGTVETQFRRKDGEIIDVLLSSTPLNLNDLSKGITFTALDITERKQAESQKEEALEAMRESESMYRRTIENASGVPYQLDLVNNKYLFIGSGIKDLVGITQKEFSPHAYSNMIIEQVVTDSDGPGDHIVYGEAFGRGEVAQYKSDVCIQTSTGNVKWISDCAVPIRDNSDQVVGSLGILLDITERKQAEEELLRYEHIVSSSNDMIALLNKNFVYLAANDRYLEPFGLARSKLIGSTVSDVFGDTFFEKIIRPNAERCLQGDRVSYCESFEFPTLGERYMEITYNPFFSPDNKITGFVVNGRDITESKLAEEELRKLAAVVKYSSELVNLATLEGNIIFLNEAGGKMLGIDPDNVHNVNIMEVIPDHWTELVEKELIPAILKGGSWKGDLQYRNIKTGHLTDVYATTFTIKDPITGEPQFLANVSLDITERKQAEKALRESEEKYRNIFDRTTDIYHGADMDGKIVLVNPAGVRMSGYESADELIGQDLSRLYKDPENRKELLGELKKYGKVENYEICLKQKNGTKFFVEANVHFVFDEKGNPIGVEGLSRDITERKRAEEALRESEDKHRSIAERIYDVIMVAQLDGEISYVSPSVRRVFGHQPEDLVGRNITEFVSEAEIPHAIETLQLSSEGGNVEGHHSDFLKNDGSYATIELNAVPIYKNDKIIGTQSVIRDITETKRLQELESRAERLEMAGTIAGQVAHDFNNLLAPIMAYPEFIHEELPHDHKAHAYLDAIEEAAAKIADINQDLLTMGRRGHYNQTVLDINRVVLHAAQEMESRTKTVAVELELGKDLKKIKGGSAQIHRMLTNLLVNAQDAMEDIGKVTIRTENYYADDTSIAFGRVPKGEYVKLTVTDNGCGIADNIIHKILDPFFTSKTTDKKRGSGLGLSVVDAVIRDHNGYLDLSTRLGGGTSFYIYFPITHDTANDVEVAKQDGGTEKVLIIDDDAIQRDVSSRLLKKLGYIVTTIESGEKGIEFIKNNPQDLVILDMIMPPGIDGTETFRQILEIYPEQKAIFISGFSETDRILEGQKMGAGAFVKKPLTKKAIAAAVRKELDRDKKIGVS